jgi:predicted methyltransferase
MSALRRIAASSVIPLVLLMTACAGMPGGDGVTTPEISAAVAAPDRTDADRQVDKRRNPEKLLAFAGVRPGMKVLEIGAGGGYTAELLARIVGPSGTVYAQHDVKETRATPIFNERAKKPVMKNVTLVTRPFDDPLPPEARNLDLITFLFAYHDTTFMAVDRAKMNKALFAALKPGGQLVVADHSAKAGDGIGVAKDLHRIEESVLRREIEAAGFRLVGESNFLRNPNDPRTERVFQSKVPVDEFVLRFVKP